MYCSSMTQQSGEASWISAPSWRGHKAEVRYFYFENSSLHATYVCSCCLIRVRVKLTQKHWYLTSTMMIMVQLLKKTLRCLNELWRHFKAAAISRFGAADVKRGLKGLQGGLFLLESLHDLKVRFEKHFFVASSLHFWVLGLFVECDSRLSTNRLSWVDIKSTI